MRKFFHDVAKNNDFELWLLHRVWQVRAFILSERGTAGRPQAMQRQRAQGYKEDNSIAR
jgi:hypothetical protein